MSQLDDLIATLTTLRDEGYRNVHILGTNYNEDGYLNSSPPVEAAVRLNHTGRAVYLTTESSDVVSQHYGNLVGEYIPYTGRPTYEVQAYSMWPASKWITIFTTTDREEAKDFYDKVMTESRVQSVTPNGGRSTLQHKYSKTDQARVDNGGF